MNSLVGTGALVRLALRRDRMMLPVWILSLAAIAASTGSATKGLFPDVASRVQAATTSNNTPSLVALYGRNYDPTSLGELAVQKMTGPYAALVAVLAILVVVRHTRAEEETGRLELVGATVVGRHAALTAAFIVAVGTSLVLGVLTALGLIGAGLPSAGSVAFGLGWAGVGIAFAAIAAVTAQVTASARTANATAMAVLGATYVLRAIGDTAAESGPTWLSWLSPIGWEQQVRPYAGDRWWVLLLTVGFAVVVAPGAYALVAWRDQGAGLLADRPGPATAAAGLRSSLALAWRLHRGALLGWAAGFVLLGAVFGSVATNAGNMLDNPQARDLITKLGGQKGLTDAFLAAELAIVGVIASVYGVQAAMRLRSEETALRVEPILATAVGRITWAFSHITMTLVGTTTLLLGAGLGGGVAYGAQTHDMGRIGHVLGGALVQLPAVWVVTSIVVAAFGLAPRLIVIGWAALAVFLLLGELGPLLKLAQWAMDISPFAHVPKIPGAELTAAPMLWLVGVAAALTAAGLIGFRRRDIG